MARKRQAVSLSKTIMTELVLPNHTNALGTAFGGVIVSWMDIAAAIAAQRFCGSSVVTASIDALHFLSPVKLGHVVNLVAQVNYAGRTSMEVGVRIDAENPISGERTYTAKAYLTFVAIDETGNAVTVPEALVESDDEQRRYRQAEIRRKARLELARELKQAQREKRPA
ncbi:MAG: acyl-CoA thioesterase [Myxococcales bacterium]|nr:acyl-CoA thioesterase [Myxococcales bacterium]